MAIFHNNTQFQPYRNLSFTINGQTVVLEVQPDNPRMLSLLFDDSTRRHVVELEITDTIQECKLQCRGYESIDLSQCMHPPLKNLFEESNQNESN